MQRFLFVWAGLLLIVLGPSLEQADGNLNRVNHIIVVMQENHSFDNYFGALGLSCLAATPLAAASGEDFKLSRDPQFFRKLRDIVGCICIPRRKLWC
jgi:hypothetical protein